MEVHQLARLVGSFIDDGGRYVEPILKTLNACPVSPWLGRLIERLERTTGRLKSQDAAVAIEVLESLIHRGYVRMDRFDGKPRVFDLTDEGKKAIGVDRGRLSAFPEPDVLHYSEYREDLPERQPRDPSTIRMTPWG